MLCKQTAILVGTDIGIDNLDADSGDVKQKPKRCLPKRCLREQRV
jgi:hypothetical protein